MSKGKILFFLFVVLEFVLLFELGAAIGALPVVLWVILMMFVGINMIIRAFTQARNPLTLNPIVLILQLFAGVLLFFPGIISDVLAVLVLLIPRFRAFACSRVSQYDILNRSSFSRFFGQNFESTSRDDMGNPDFSGTNKQDNAPYGQPSHSEQPKSDLQKAREHFQSKRPVIDAEYESVPDEDYSKTSKDDSKAVKDDTGSK